MATVKGLLDMARACNRALDEWKESEHKRGKGGQFGSSGGGSVKPGSSGSGTYVAHQPSGTTVPHQAGRSGSGTPIEHQPSGTTVPHQARR